MTCRLAAPIEGEVRLSRTGRSILATGHLTTAFIEPCARCLVDTAAAVEAEFEEEALPSVDIDTRPARGPVGGAGRAPPGRSS